MQLGEARRAIEHYEQALVIAREIGDRRSEGATLFNSAGALDQLGQREEAVQRAREALAILEEIGAEDLAEAARTRLTEWRAGDV